MTGLSYSCAAGDGLGVQVVYHAGLRGGPATRQLGPRGLGAHSGAAWTCCLCSSCSCLWWFLYMRSPALMFDKKHRQVEGPGWGIRAGDNLRLCVTRIPSAFSPSHSSKQTPLPSFNIWPYSGHLVSFRSSFVLTGRMDLRLYVMPAACARRRQAGWHFSQRICYLAPSS